MSKCRINIIALMLTVIVSVLTLTFIGCSDSPEQIARDTIAASKGALQTAQAEYHDSCVGNVNAPNCQLINKAISGQHLAIAALETYCQFSASSPDGQTCQPLDAALPALRASLLNLNQLTTAVKGIIK